jgi:hypothetical protein
MSKIKWVCDECGSNSVQSMCSAWFDPNNDLELVDCVEDWDMDWCNDCEHECSIMDEKDYVLKEDNYDEE